MLMILWCKWGRTTSCEHNTDQIITSWSEHGEHLNFNTSSSQRATLAFMWSTCVYLVMITNSLSFWLLPTTEESVTMPTVGSLHTVVAGIWRGTFKDPKHSKTKRQTNRPNTTYCRTWCSSKNKTKVVLFSAPPLCLIAVAESPLCVYKVLREITAFSVFCTGKSSTVFGQPCQALKSHRAWIPLGHSSLSPWM